MGGGDAPGYWFLGLLMAVCCCGAAMVVALCTNSSVGNVSPVLWSFLAGLVPSLIAGVFFARHLAHRARLKELDHDPLTGLFGEERLRNDLAVENERAKRFAKLVGVVILELDQTGRFGIPEYVAWRALARMMRQKLRLSDNTYVLAPGRFAVLLSATTEEGGRVVIDRMRQSVKDVPELFGVKIRFGHQVLNPAAAGDAPPARVLDGALEDAKRAAVETTVPPLPQPSAGQ